MTTRRKRLWRVARPALLSLAAATLIAFVSMSGVGLWRGWRLAQIHDAIDTRINAATATDETRVTRLPALPEGVKSPWHSWADAPPGGGIPTDYDELLPWSQSIQYGSGFIGLPVRNPDALANYVQETESYSLTLDERLAPMMRDDQTAYIPFNRSQRAATGFAIDALRFRAFDATLRGELSATVPALEAWAVALRHLGRSDELEDQAQLRKCLNHFETELESILLLATFNDEQLARIRALDDVVPRRQTLAIPLLNWGRDIAQSHAAPPDGLGLRFSSSLWPPDLTRSAVTSGYLHISPVQFRAQSLRRRFDDAFGIKRPWPEPFATMTDSVTSLAYRLMNESAAGETAVLLYITELADLVESFDDSVSDAEQVRRLRATLARIFDPNRTNPNYVADVILRKHEHLLSRVF